MLSVTDSFNSPPSPTRPTLYLVCSGPRVPLNGNLIAPVNGQVGSPSSDKEDSGAEPINSFGAISRLLMAEEMFHAGSTHPEGPNSCRNRTRSSAAGHWAGGGLMLNACWSRCVLPRWWPKCHRCPETISMYWTSSGHKLWGENNFGMFSQDWWTFIPEHWGVLRVLKEPHRV